MLAQNGRIVACAESWGLDQRRLHPVFQLQVSDFVEEATCVSGGRLHDTLKWNGVALYDHLERGMEQMLLL